MRGLDGRLSELSSGSDVLVHSFCPGDAVTGLLNLKESRRDDSKGDAVQVYVPLYFARELSSYTAPLVAKGL